MFLHTFLVSHITASNLAPRGYWMSLWLSSLQGHFPCDVVGSILANTCITYHVIATGNLNNRNDCTNITLWSFSNNDIYVVVRHLKNKTVLETLVDIIPLLHVHGLATLRLKEIDIFDVSLLVAAYPLR